MRSLSLGFPSNDVELLVWADESDCANGSKSGDCDEPILLIEWLDGNSLRTLNDGDTLLIDQYSRMPTVSAEVSGGGENPPPFLISAAVNYYVKKELKNSAGDVTWSREFFYGPEFYSYAAPGPDVVLGTEYWELPWWGDVRGGDVTIYYQLEGHDPGELNFKIRGTNPNPITVAAFAQQEVVFGDPVFWYLPAILWHESRFEQFNPRGTFLGQPNWGWPNGWGMGQIDYGDSPVPAQYLWSWTANMFKARDTMTDKIAAHNRYLNAVAYHWGAQYCDPFWDVYVDFKIGQASWYRLPMHETDIMKRYNGANYGKVTLNTSTGTKIYSYVWAFEPTEPDCGGDGGDGAQDVKWTYHGWTRVNDDGDTVGSEPPDPKNPDSTKRNYIQHVLVDAASVGLLP